MNKIIKVYKYQLRDALIPVAVFYGAILFLTIFISASIANAKVSNGTVSGLEFASAIFIFIAGLNCFKSNFKFMQFFHVSRRTFYFSSILSLLSIAAGMTVIDTILGKFFTFSMHYTTLFETTYSSGGFFIPVLWEFVLLSMFAIGGWFITMLYYRSNKLVKIIISLSPVYVSFILRFAGSSLNGLFHALSFLLGFSGGSPLVNVLGMCITILLTLVLNFLLIRKAPVKN